ncbi:hypothetical protein EYZ11_006246 [Aspergillus tanneri]|uniref:Microsomal glutathione S-transferase 3 n=1 Tax=Aspergillus tanneri TaxID=1220188 RepID=A0A4S3JFZ6_9EURO|nr:hypothetical protein EYZ11_006246 [Aspergillus tanneri]
MSSPQISGLLGPVVALNAWTFAMEVWMYAVRIPFLEKHRIAADNTITKSQLDAKTPTSVRWKVDNFNHLFEQPTQFYAISLVLAFARHGKNEKLDVYLGWAYVGARILHSLVHVTTNNVMRRFFLFALSSGILATMTGRAALLVF